MSNAAGFFLKELEMTNPEYKYLIHNDYSGQHDQCNTLDDLIDNFAKLQRQERKECAFYKLNSEIKNHPKIIELLQEKDPPVSKELSDLSSELHNERNAYHQLIAIARLLNKHELFDTILELKESFAKKLARFKELLKEFPHQKLCYNYLKSINEIDYPKIDPETNREIK